ncbi:MAG: AAA family ATPase [Candidatus Kerfeldbacteria bacterium CG15_BIG_FIL_POST_REV_8_21_14_020_45_12]|uniref:AAA family ATPase n=1 Tax=Candidatus Kerfeldbacteria bacterium CG15_BIG_FIL_POST_REV_8_21_14_020_45_12 TaxID=2014247 RepID=A0A2M7H222_9BACT|nr:MAG: AAA family ATPase [Candidatus Kerfeldbacteria bacterium CG15_BIG_FIL_POST_REV_8_21_14_020_45_12]PJA93431.1 MAG: AAA family ATPase [Candidatus Kerfeldbacteria bacterium CG_4_9_14_3_um_filter_45_8]
MNTLFDKPNPHAPLAEKLRPTSLDDFVGQEELIGPGTMLRELIERDEIPSMILWGPPGSGKTTLATIIAAATGSQFTQLSAVSTGKKDLKQVLEKAKTDREFYQKKSILFLDEIHRWNKGQQDALLPAVEKGDIVLIGATTENPSFEVNSALLSRTQVFVLKQLTEEQIGTLLKRAAGELKVKLPEDVVDFLASLANGDARTALNTLELAHQSGKPLTKTLIKESVQKTFLYDKSGEEHFNMISALHKTMRASDPNAALYWLARMLQSGEDPLYVARRIIRFASEDVGNEKPTGLVLAVAAYNTCHYLGMPECNLALAQAVEYLARAPKSRSLDSAWSAIMKDIIEEPNAPVPMHLRNAPTKLMKELGYGDRDQESNLPENLAGRVYLSN